MKGNKCLFLTLVISAFLIISAFGGMVIPVGAEEESLEVVKKVWDEDLSEWVEEIDVDNGDTVSFQITITYHNVTQPQYPHYAENIIVNDTLPDGLDYVSGSASPFEPDVNGNVLTWDLGSTKLYDDESYTITFDATVDGEGELENLAESVADEHCTGQVISGSDTAIVNVIELNPGISVEKYVFDGCEWVETIQADDNSDVLFKIVVENTGDTDLEVYVNDTLPECLIYNDSATPFEPDIINDILVWYFALVEPEEEIIIQFEAHVEGDPCTENVNLVEVTGITGCLEEVTDSDTASVLVNGMCVEKQVWDDGEWAEETDAAVGDTVRFKIKITYYGDLVLKQIKVRDELPACLEYADNAVPEEPEVSGKTLWWNLSSDYNLQNGESVEIEFDADVVDNNCEPAENWAYVDALECGIYEWYGEDSAIVNIGCEFIAIAGGPYYGEIDEEIEITGDASGGSPPYTYDWDLDDDGDYDDATGKTIYETWSEKGNYPISLRVTDDDGDKAYDDTVVIIGYGDNAPPNKPAKPFGPTSGKRGVTYPYTTSTTDPDGDQVEYKFDWGDGTDSGWLGPYDSGDTCEASHKWSSVGGFSVKVKARDVPHFAESPWSEPLSVSMPRNRAFSNPIIIQFLQLLLQKIPILQQILGL